MAGPAQKLNIWDIYTTPSIKILKTLVDTLGQTILIIFIGNINLVSILIRQTKTAHQMEVTPAFA
jgi:hypothetical protein